MSKKSFTPPSRIVAALTVIAAPLTLLGWSPPARADIPPSCSQEDSLITCAAADVGKPCQGGGTCYAIQCNTSETSFTSGTVYKCDSCPTVISTADGACSSATTLGTACGDGGTCTVLSTWCRGSSEFACSVPAAAQPAGPPDGETNAGTGCAIATGVPTTAGIAMGLLAIGLAFLLLSRRRRTP